MGCHMRCSNAWESTDVSFKYEADFSSSSCNAHFFEHKFESHFFLIFFSGYNLTHGVGQHEMALLPKNV